MKRLIALIILATFLISLASAEIIITQQPKDIYNMGEVIKLPVKITSATETNNFLLMKLICNGKEIEIHKEFISLKAGEEKSVTSSAPLIQSFTGKNSGTCKIKASIGEEYVLTNEFTISDKIDIAIAERKTEFTPGDNLILEGDATKINQQVVTGFVKFTLTLNGEEKINLQDTTSNGYFFLNTTIPKDFPAGQYLAHLQISEEDYEGAITNNGFVDYNVLVAQVPTSLEIIFENTEVEPGTDMQVKAILHDQSGEKITPSTIVISVKNTKDKILTQEEVATDEYLSYPIEYKEPSAEWKVVAVSTKLTSESTFKILEKEDIKITILNKTLTIKNTGNVIYNKTVVVNIGEETLSIETSLGIDEEIKYILSAPNGEYEVKIRTDNGEEISQQVMLTGDSINIKKLSQGVVAFVRHPLVWIFVIIILAFVVYIIYRKGYKKAFFGHVPSLNPFKKKGTHNPEPLRKKSLITSTNKAELSLSLKGDKQNISLVGLKIKNLSEIESKKTGAEETLQKIVNLADEAKASTYENGDNLFFLFIPAKTKTFKNEMLAIKLAQNAKELLDAHNKMLKQKINYGISVNYGTIVAKSEPDSVKFMSMGTLITIAKRVATISNQEILLSEKFKEKTAAEIKTDKHHSGNLDVYSIKEIRDRDSNKKFIGDFIRRLEGKS